MVEDLKDYWKGVLTSFLFHLPSFLVLQGNNPSCIKSAHFMYVTKVSYVITIAFTPACQTGKDHIPSIRCLISRKNLGQFCH